MKILQPILSILVLLFLNSCQPQAESQAESFQPKADEWQVQPFQPQQQQTTVAELHTVTVQEVIQGNSYTYLKVKEEDQSFWMAISRRQIEPGETFSFKNPLEMKNFTSKELQRTFETIFFISEISSESSRSANQTLAADPNQEPAAPKQVISIEPIEGGVTIGELFSNRDSYADKIIRIKGQVVKVNRAIMGQNWVHLQDGTGDSKNNDLTVTTKDEVVLGSVVIFEGKIILNKDFGSGYSYGVLMEEAKLQAD
jgi:hypothetical protein